MIEYIKPLRTNNTTSRHISIAYLGPKVLAPMQTKMLNGMRKVAFERDIALFHFYGPFPYDSPEIISQSTLIYKLISSKNLDGIICWSSQLWNENGYFFNIEKFLTENSNIPVVFIGKVVKDYPTLLIDNFHGINTIMNHLIHVHNYRKLAFIRGPEYHSYSEERYKAYVNTLKSNGIAFNPQLVTPPYEFINKIGKKAKCFFLDKLKLKPKEDIEAIVSVSDLLSFPAIIELKKRNIHVPHDIAVVGFNNRYDSLSSKPMMTTVDINFEGIGAKSLELLLSIIKAL